ncbi:hypothetical protein AOQ84DRAFT_222961 [Glonium stellatum]|uniref:Uncharacterized protein n=1 Tax=Glonium stellatum TaxID=574774 RepID=A0A8E2EYM8_9PEZI|nr:hypothetical protein AOQ84DRAFT_222961 [Glonium stellatum]
MPPVNASRELGRMVQGGSLAGAREKRSEKGNEWMREMVWDAELDPEHAACRTSLQQTQLMRRANRSQHLARSRNAYRRLMRAAAARDSPGGDGAITAKAEGVRADWQARRQVVRGSERLLDSVIEMARIARPMGPLGDLADRPAMATGIIWVAYSGQQRPGATWSDQELATLRQSLRSLPTSTNCPRSTPTETTSAMRISAPVSSSCQYRRKGAAGLLVHFALLAENHAAHWLPSQIFCCPPGEFALPVAHVWMLGQHCLVYCLRTLTDVCLGLRSPVCSPGVPDQTRLDLALELL